MFNIAHGAASLVLLGATTINLPFIHQASPMQVATAPTFVSQKAAIKTASEPVAPAPTMVTVVEGDTLSSIAEAHQSTYARVFAANDSIVSPDVINPGQQLRIPTAEETLPDRPLPAPVAPAPVVTPSTHSASAGVKTASVKTTYAPVSGNDAKAFIYAKESGNNPNATNPNGCYGLGQDCNGVVRASCGADYACQDAYFTNYAMKRYGSWEGAVNFWNANGWW